VLRLRLAAVAVGFAMGCASEPTRPHAAPPSVVAVPAVQPQGGAQPETDPALEPPGATGPTSGLDSVDRARTPAPDASPRPWIEVSEPIRRACHLSDSDARFAHDSTIGSEPAARVLRTIAQCFTTGPLAGRRVRLVGHSDPRGSPEYNLVLGARYANAVKTALAGFHLADDQIAVTSRGDMDATGVDEPSWSNDRRVEIEIGK